MLFLTAPLNLHTPPNSHHEIKYKNKNKNNNNNNNSIGLSPSLDHPPTWSLAQARPSFTTIGGYSRLHMTVLAATTAYLPSACRSASKSAQSNLDPSCTLHLLRIFHRSWLRLPKPSLLVARTCSDPFSSLASRYLICVQGWRPGTN